MFFFDWLTARVRDAVLTGINQALEQMNAAATQQPSAPPVALTLSISPATSPTAPAAAADHAGHDDHDAHAGSNGRRKRASV